MNELFIAFSQRKVVQEVSDKRYRCLISLIRSDRPRHWNYLCNNCGSKVVTIMNLEVLAGDDFFDGQNINNAGIGKDCKGVDSNGLPCQYTYFFVVR